MKELETDVVVVGTGGAGCRAALTARSQGCRVVQVAKGPIGRCELTAMTMPSFGALLKDNPRDSAHNFFKDTLDGGAYLNDRNLVNTLVNGSGEAIGFLEGLGVRFDRHPDGTFMYYSGVEHTITGTPRQLGVDDCMGRTFYNALKGEIGRSGIHLVEDFFAAEVLSDGKRVRGLIGLDIRTGQIMVIWASAVILATGGFVGLYNIRTGHPRDTGDGQAMALRAGAGLKDIEFIQSNPAAFHHPPSIRGVIVPGWYLVMDKGAKYFNGEMTEFLHNYDPVRRENTTRDIKARAMHQEIISGRTSANGGIYLDFRGVKLETPLEDYLSEKAPFLLDYVRRLGLPPQVIFKTPMEVAPAAHYSCGGIAIDEACQTGVPGLLAAGEVTGGVHGANRLGNSAMTDIFVFGRIAGEQAVRAARTKGPGPISKGLADKAAQFEREVGKIMSGDARAPLRPPAVRARVEEVMFRHVGFGRDRDGLEQALNELERIRTEDLPRAGPSSNSPVFNIDLIQTLELANMIDIGQAVARAALERTETRGCHNRLDFPLQDDQDWLIHLLVTRQGAELKVDKTPVIT